MTINSCAMEVLLKRILLLMVILSSVLLTSNGFRLVKTTLSTKSCTSTFDSNNYQIENIIYKTCKNCKKQYDSKGKDVKCRFHAGIYTGRLNRVNDVDTSGLEYFWSCCGNEELSSPGCTINEYHVSYDDSSNDQYSRLTGKKIKY